MQPALLISFLISCATALECPMGKGTSRTYRCGLDVNETETRYCERTFRPNGTEAYRGCTFISCKKAGCSDKSGWVICCSENATIPLPPPSMTENFAPKMREALERERMTSTAAVADVPDNASPDFGTVPAVVDPNEPDGAGSAAAAMLLGAAAALAAANY
ncbi:hypothetical protein PRIPAC_91314 [Pristionchus pacificus]|uniref:Uncharacterized protein n=1 Tax=Pristionchus pacificus TaxID=54126 RepID=A0A2A6B922_PRIPA|nr:hypothetical protein PRIPAC_91314 [Pristionchus pacificus]|eukprot:PDM62368.1 hypothetical protein PRIPAC_51810 [Pristionchus pacificus]